MDRQMRYLRSSVHRTCGWALLVCMCLIITAMADLRAGFAQEKNATATLQQIVLLGHEPAAEAFIGQRQPIIRVRLAGGGVTLDPASITLER